MGRAVEEPVNAQAGVLIVGTGALATFFAARLSASGTAVTVLGSWEAGLAALRRDGAGLIDAAGAAQHARVRATRDARDCRGARLALVLVKAWQTERAAAQLQECLAPDGLAVSLQNGLGNRESLVRFLGASRVALGVTTAGATLVAPGLARSGGEGGVSLEMPRPYPARRALLSELEDWLKAADFQVETVADAASLVWGKLVANTAINPLTALLGVANGVLLERPGARAAMAELAGETAGVAAALGVNLAFSDPAGYVQAVARQTALNLSSMLQDVRRGAPTEIDAICGAVMRAGEEKGLRVTANRMMWRLVSALGTPSQPPPSVEGRG